MFVVGLPGWEEVESPKEAASMAEAANQEALDTGEELSNQTYSEKQVAMERELESGMVE